jgi:GNAT superfamily N-acetyltransferase
VRPGVTVRAGRTDDLAELARIMEANDEGVGWPDMPELGYPYLEHVLRHARLRVADLDGRVVGIGASADLGSADVRMVTDLFVDPETHDRGAGRALLDAVLEDATERLTFSSADDRALGLYIRAGMRPLWPLLYLEVGPGRLGPHDHGVEVRPADPAETARWSAAWTGLDRSSVFEHYAALPEATGFAVIDAGAVAAVGWARREQDRSDGRWLSHASIAPDADPVRAVFALLRAAAGDEPLNVPVPGPHPAVAALIEGGARIGGRDTFCATDAGLVDPVRILPDPAFL